MHKTVPSAELITLFHNLDKRLFAQFYSFTLPKKKFDLITIGGTALGLLNLKYNSKDIDLFIELSSLEKIQTTQKPMEFAGKLRRFIQEYFDGSEEMGADVSYEGLKS